MKNQCVEVAEIMKFQRAIIGNDLCLVYSKDRSIMDQFPMEEDLKTLFDEDYKIYVWAKYNEKTTKIEIIRKLNNKELKKVDW